MNKQADDGQLFPSIDAVSSFRVSIESNPGVAGAGVAVILQHLKKAEKLALTQLGEMNNNGNNGSNHLGKQIMAMALVDIGSAIEEVTEAEAEITNLENSTLLRGR